MKYKKGQGNLSVKDLKLPEEFMAVPRTFPGFVIYLNFKDSAFLRVKRDATFSIRYKKGILFLMEGIRIYQS